MDINEFRQKLDDVTKESRPYNHKQLIDSLKGDYPHNITRVSPLMGGDDCFLYVFREKIPDDVLKNLSNIIEDKPEIFEEIGKKLMSKGFLSLHNEKREDDEIVIYFDNGIAKHFGKIVDDKIESKWGRGCAWRHNLFEVPLSYGNIVKFSAGEIDLNVLIETIKDIKI